MENILENLKNLSCDFVLATIFTIKELSANFLHGIKWCSLALNSIKRPRSQMLYKKHFSSPQFGHMKIIKIFINYLKFRLEG